MKMFIIGLAVVFIVLFSAISSTHAATPNESELAVFNYTNELRSQYGLPPYRLSCILTDSARAKSEHMDQNGYFSHWTPSGLGPEYWKVLYGYPPNSPGWGENILWGASSGYEAYTIWANSPDHRDNMLGTLYTEVGIGYAGGNHYWGVYTMHFGNGNTASCASTPDPEQPQNFDTTTTANLRIRQNPSTQGTILGTLPYGSGVIFLDGEAIADGYTWYYVASRGYEGWVAGAYLAGYNAPPPPTTTPPPSTDEGVSFTTSTRLNLRVGAGTSYGVIQTMPAGTTVTDYDGELRYANGYTWRSVQTPYGIGWVATAYLY